jgi:hypothetical protein
MATGTGMSLEVAKGGHDFLLEEEYKPRFELLWGDINAYQLGSHPLPNLAPFPITPETHPAGFALVLLDGHPLRTAASSEERVHKIGDRLLISQLIIGLTAVTQGGTVVIKLSRPNRLITAQLMWLFDQLAMDVRTWKPVCIHATRDTFYLIARGMGFGRRADIYGMVLHSLKALWIDLACKERRLSQNDLNFIVQEEVLLGPYKRRFEELSAHLWAVQSAAWKGWRQQVKSGF